ncbi:MAG: acetate--CoA ligase family protein [Patescibacteria group bacterium]|nr:acetate--CoA ligase family protein [Patescibacteria group bacterium]MDD4610772.1 acetate--CoA ligase family protein [Patescibacteria group bacterium]
MNLNTLFNPQSIAIIGASRDKEKLGYQILNNIRSGGYRGKIFPINLKAETIDGLEAFKSVKDAKEKIDLAVIVIPAKFVLSEIRNCADAGIKNLVIISAGFSETDAEGKKAEEEIRKIAAEFGLNILGPNCLGFINSYNDLNLTFAKTPPFLPHLPKESRQGRVAIISQSGAIESAVLDWFGDKNFGFSYFISIGNAAVLDENDFFEFLAQDKNTDLIIAYLEEIKDGQRFMEVVSRLSRLKPFAVLKAGRTKAGKIAALSHTGSLAGSDEAIMTGLRRSGAVILEKLEDIFNLTRLAARPAKIKDNNIYIVSNAGGPLVLTTDELEKNNLPLGKFSSVLEKELKTKLSEIKNIHNPFDIIGDATADRYQRALETILADKNINNVLVLLTPQTTTEIEKTAEVISALGKKYAQKLICASFIGGDSLAKGKKILEKNFIPSFDYPEQAVRAMAQMIGYQISKNNIQIYKNNLDSRRQIAPACAGRDGSKQAIIKNKQLNYLKSFELIKKYGIKTVDNKIIKCEKDLNTLKYPIALKAVGEKIIHKTDKNLIALNLKNASEAKKAFGKFKSVLKQEGNYCLAQTMIGEGREMIVGFKRDEFFGPIIMAGAGGIYTEILKDTQTEIDDIDLPRVMKMIEKLKSYKILSGTRGQKSYDVKALAQAIVSVARLAREHSEIQELDINPLFVTRKGIIAADVRIIT